MILISALIIMLACKEAWSVPVWFQCGGIGYFGDTQCNTGSTCVYINPWYYQCQPVSSGRANVALEWQQCGGIGFNGYTTCDSYLTCVYINPWYSQCQNLGSGTTTTSAPPTTTTIATTATSSTATASTTTTASSGTVNIWEKCGGIGYTGPTVCNAGLTCVYINDWFYQCQNTGPGTTTTASSSTTTTSSTTAETSSTSTPATTSSTTTTTPSSGTVNIWEKCGGIGYTGPTVCNAGLTCVYINDWFYQCQNIGGSSTAAPTTTSASTTTGASSTSPQSTTAPSGTNKLNGCNFAYGRSFEYSANYTNFDYMTIWIGTADWDGSTDFNQYYQGVMLQDCIKYNKLPVLYAYIAAFEARNIWGLQDCDNGSPNLCQRGSEFIRQYRSYLVGRYSYQAQNIASYIGANTRVVFLIEPDFYQYYSDSNQQNGTLSGPYMRALFDDFAQAIRAQLPNAIISWDISPWATQSQMTTWWGYFQTSPYIDYIHTSGGQARPDSSNIKPNELTWSYMSQLTGKKIIADCGYGVAGSPSNNCFGWDNAVNLANRINDGIVAVSQGTLNYVPTLQATFC